MHKGVVQECIVCAFRPTLFLGRLLGFIPVVAVCPHLDKTATCQSFNKDNVQKYLGVAWLFAMLSMSVCYIWMASETEGVVQFKLLSEMFNCVNTTNVLLCTFKHIDVLLLELSGLSCIVSSRRIYHMNVLLTNCSIRFVRTFTIVTAFFYFSTYLALLISLLNGASELNKRNVVYLAGIIAGGICAATIYCQTWAKIFLVREIHKTSFSETKKLLSKPLLLPPGQLENCIEGAIRLQMAIVRNYMQSSRYWNPAFVYSLAVSCGILVSGFYMIIETRLLSLSHSNSSVQLNTVFITAAMFSLIGTQESLQNVVSIEIIPTSP